ncbi:MAG: ArsR family transcriptional regulator [Thermoplasmatota archaeon]
MGLWKMVETGPPMKRIKVINDPTELVPILRAVDTKVKRDVFRAVSEDWCTMREVEEKYGREGKEALLFFEKMKLVETKWASTGTASEKAYHTYYMSFHINTTCTVREISEILSAAVMGEKEFAALEKKILAMVGDSGRFAGDIGEAFGLSPIELKALIKRSVKMEYRGHRIERIPE